MESSSFYVTLPSNASMNLFPFNKQSSYKVQLPKTLYLPGQYEVALAEIHFPVSWATFAKSDSYKIVIKNKDNGNTLDVYIPGMSYETIKHLVFSINSAIVSALAEIRTDGDSVLLELDEPLGKVIVICKDPYVINFSEEMNDVLGLQNAKWHSRTIGRYRHNLSRGFTSLYVYSSVCAPQIVGDTYAPLLRNVAIKGRRDEYLVKTYPEPHYVNVNTDQVDLIEMNIKDDTGEDVPFMSGKVICKLHFRQKTL